MQGAHSYIDQKLKARQQAGAYRRLRPESNLIDFCSNDYLSFARSESLQGLINREHNGDAFFFNGSTGSRLLAGNNKFTEETEAWIAQYHQAEAALLFNSGYDANLGLFSSLPQRGDTIILDELAHASIIDGARLSNANRFTFKHNNLASLEQKLKAAKGNIYIGIESVYSMDGDTPPLRHIVELAEAYNAALIVDEAHAIGLYKHGLLQHLDLHQRVFARVITFGKALGCHGAVVVGSTLLRNYLINFARSFIYTTAAPPHQIHSIKCAYALLSSADERILKLHQLITFFTSQIINTQAMLLPSQSAIQCIILGSNQKAKVLSQLLANEGLDVRAIMSRTVAPGTERLRICLHTHNTANEVLKLAAVLNKFIYE